MTPLSVAIGSAGTVCELLPERALWWPQGQALIVADLHWGKAETFQASGIALPTEAFYQADLVRLDGLLKRYQPTTVYVLGDLVHHHHGLTETLIEWMDRWLRGTGCQWVLVGGNHDRWGQKAFEQWPLTLVEEPFRVGPWALCHHPQAVPGAYALAGHLHPVVTVKNGYEQLRLPCFSLGQDRGILPAFSQLSGGYDLAQEATYHHDTRYAIVEEAVLALPPNRSLLYR